MKTMKAAILLTASLMLACGTQTEIEPKEQPLEPTSEHYLVWWGVEEGGYSTALVRARNEDPEVLAEGSGLFIAAGESIWSWEERTQSSAQIDCACQMEARGEGDESDCSVSRDVVSAELLEVDGSRSIDAFPVQEEYEGEVEPNPNVLGSTGPILMSADCHYGYFCGAHGSVECQYKAWNLATGESVTADQIVRPLSQADQVGLLNEEPRDELVTPDTLIGLVEVRPRWGDSGDVRLEALYAASACYACTDGEWSSYTIAARHEDAEPTIELEDAPGAVLELWNTTTGPRGWSRLADTEVERARAILR